MPASHHPTALNSIFDTVHRHMRTVKRVIPSVPSIPQPILDISNFKGKEPVSYKLPLGYRAASTPVPAPPIDEPKPNTIKFRPSHTSVKRSRVHFKVTKKVKPEVAKLEQKLSRNISEKKSSLKTPPPKKEQQKIMQTNIINTKTKKSLPQTKADLQMKTQLNKRRNVAQTESLLSQDSAYSERQVKIMKEILRQKEMCSDMLKDYGRLKRSRETLAREMMSMKDYLDDIKSRLDDSVKQLTGSPTVYEKGVAAKRVNLAKKFQDKFRPKTDQRPIKVPNLID